MLLFENEVIMDVPEIADVVGQIQSVQGSDLTDAGVTTRVVVRLVIDP